jgi:hypothetical protein
MASLDHESCVVGEAPHFNPIKPLAGIGDQAGALPNVLVMAGVSSSRVLPLSTFV